MVKLDMLVGETAEMFFKRRHGLGDSPKLKEPQVLGPQTDLPSSPLKKEHDSDQRDIGQVNGQVNVKSGRRRTSGRVSSRPSTKLDPSGRPNSKRKRKLDVDVDVDLNVKLGPETSLPTTFDEPELATPIPIYTGLPLETPPSNKIKKESLWPKKSSKVSMSSSSSQGNGSSNGSGTGTGTGTPTGTQNGGNSDFGDSESLPIEAAYNRGLQTQKLDDLAIQSEQREGIRRRLSRRVDGTPKKYVYDNPELDEFLLISSRSKLVGHKQHEEHHKTKRIKVTSPKKPQATHLLKIIEDNIEANEEDANEVDEVDQLMEKKKRKRKAKMDPATSKDKDVNIKREAAGKDVSERRKISEEEETKHNDDYCFTCGSTGVFICCDTCPKLFHFTCCEPPLEELPEDNWHCLDCTAKLNGKKNWKYIGIFGNLMGKIEGKNPGEFMLPVGIRNTFHGVETGYHGQYQDDSLLPELTARQIKERDLQIAGCNVDAALEVDRNYRPNGDPYLCHKCGESGQNNRTLAHCDYCPLVWHIDCVFPPLPKAKTLGSKWKCPNHLDELIVPLVLSRRMVDSHVVDVSLYNHYLMIATASNFCIKNLEDKYLEDPELYESYIQRVSETEELASVPENHGSKACTPEVKKPEDSTGKKDTETVSESSRSSSVGPDMLKARVPEYYRNSSFTPRGIAARPAGQLKQMLSSGNTGQFLYRVPEELIVLDFIDRAHREANKGQAAKQAKQTKQTKQTIMNGIEHYELQKRLEENEDDLVIVEGLCSVRRGDLNINELLKAAMALTPSPDIPTQTKTLDDTEIQELRQIKKLMEIKGQEALLGFLKK